MRVLVASWAWPTHFYPIVPLAWALRAAGHDVRVLTQPALVPLVHRCGLSAIPVGADTTVPAGALAPGRPAPRRRLGQSVRIATAMLPGTRAAVDRYRPDLIVHEPTTYAAPLAALEAGIPSVRHLWGVDVHTHARDVEAEAFAELAAPLGIGVFGSDGAATIDPCPARLQTGAPIRRLAMRYTPFNGPGAVPRWLRAPAARPRILVTGGISRTFQGDGAAAGMSAGAIASALARDGVEVILAVSPDDRRRLGPLPDPVRVAELLPLALVLPTCEAIVSPGGNGSLMTAVLAGVPQVCVPGQPADRVSAQAVHDAGAGIALEPDAAPEDVRAAVDRVRGEHRFRDAAGDLRAQAWHRPSPHHVVGRLESLVNTAEERRCA